MKKLSLTTVFVTTIALTTTLTTTLTDAYVHYEDEFENYGVNGIGDLKNWEGSVMCPQQLTYFPNSIEQVVEYVKENEKVRASGAGASFNDFYCSGNGGAVIKTTNMNQILDIVTEGTDRPYAVIQSGMVTREALVQLNNHGWTLMTAPWYIDQTLGGGVSTATHGSSIRYGSLSSRATLKGIKLVLADGSIKYIDDDVNSEEMDALRVGVGLFGVIVEVHMYIKPDRMVARQRDFIDEEGLIPILQRAQADPMSVDNMNLYWFVALRKVGVSTLSNTTSHGVTVKGNAYEDNFPGYTPGHKNPSLGTVIENVWTFIQEYFPDKIEKILQSSIGWGWGWITDFENTKLSQIPYLIGIMFDCIYPGVMPESWARPHMLNALDDVMNGVHLYDQYEYAIPFSKMVDCVQTLLDAKQIIPEGKSQSDIENSAVSPYLVRFVGQEPMSHLSYTNDEPRVYINMEDFRSYDVAEDGSPKIHPGWKQQLDILESDKCHGRLHWGKAQDTYLNGSWSKVGWDYQMGKFIPTFQIFDSIRAKYDPTGKFDFRDGRQGRGAF